MFIEYLVSSHQGASVTGKLTIVTFMKVVRDNPEFGNRAKHCIIAALLVFLGFALIWNAFAKSRTDANAWEQTQSDLAMEKHRQDIETYFANHTVAATPATPSVERTPDKQPAATHVAVLRPKQQGQYTVAIAPGVNVDLTDEDLDQALGINLPSTEILALAEEVRREQEAKEKALETIVVEALPEFVAPKRPDLNLQTLTATLEKIEKPFLRDFANQVSISLNDAIALTLIHAGWVEEGSLTEFKVVPRYLSAAKNGAEVFADKLQMGNDTSPIENGQPTIIDFSNTTQLSGHAGLKPANSTWEIHYGAIANQGAQHNALRVLPAVEVVALTHPTTHSHLSSVANAYWQLYRDRASVAISQQNLESLEQWLKLTKESETEANKLRLAKRKRELERALVRVHQSQSQLAQLVGHRLLNTGSIEIVPNQTPSLDEKTIDPSAELITAINNRKEIEAEVERLKASISRFTGDQQALLQSLISRITNPGQPELTEDVISQVAIELAHNPNQAMESIEIEVKLACQELQRASQLTAMMQKDVGALFRKCQEEDDDLDAFVDLQNQLQIVIDQWLEQTVELQGALLELNHVTGTLVFENKD